jgi:hypothetical protein
MGIKVALITDMDVKPLEWSSTSTEEEIEKAKASRKQALKILKMTRSKYFSPNWTLEYEISISLFQHRVL